MKRRIILSIALALSVVLVSLMSSDRAAKAQPGGRVFVADTGIVTLRPNQVLRMAAHPENDDAFNAVAYLFRSIEYSQGACSGDGVCRLAVASQTTSNPITVKRGEGASFDIPSTAFGVRGVVLSNNRNTRVIATIIDAATGNVVAAYSLENVQVSS